MDRQEIIAKMAKLAATKNPPQTQYDVCLIAARCSIAAGDIPRTDKDFIDAAYGMAAGLFGPAFASADYAQKTTWIDMCERALREAASLSYHPQ